MSALESMTGYGEARLSLSNGQALVCRVKSVNHRFLDLKIRLPRHDFGALEGVIRKTINDQFIRGAIELSISFETQQAQTEAKLNTKLAEAYWKTLSKLATTLSKKKSNLEVSLDSILRLPGVFSSENSDFEISSEEEKKILKKLVEPALDKLKKARIEEGTKLAAHMRQLVDQLGVYLQNIADLENPEKERLRQIVIDRIQETLKALSQYQSSPTTEFDARLREEASFWIEKRDFEEERIRFGVHLKNFKQLLDSKEPALGRKLEFLQQELLRETNTLGTKAQSTLITGQTIEMKSLLEKLKEQLANVC